MKTLYRSRKQRIIGGVAGGISEYFEIDPIFIRVLFIITVFTGGIGLIAYIVLWIIAPNEPFEFSQTNGNKSNYYDAQSGEWKSNPEAEQSFSTSGNAVVTDSNGNKNKIRVLGGIILVVLGLVVLLDNIIPGFDFSYIWSIILILIGLYIIFASPKMRKDHE